MSDNAQYDVIINYVDNVQIAMSEVNSAARLATMSPNRSARCATCSITPFRSSPPRPPRLQRLRELRCGNPSIQPILPNLKTGAAWHC